MNFCFFNLIFNIVYIVEIDAHPCESSVRVGRVEEWKKVDRTNASFFSLCLQGRKERGPPFAVRLHRHPEIVNGPLMKL